MVEEIRMVKGEIFDAKEFVCYPEDEIKLIAEGEVRYDGINIEVGDKDVAHELGQIRGRGKVIWIKESEQVNDKQYI